MTNEKEKYLEILRNSYPQYIRHDICNICGGQCCKTQSCTVFPFDITPFSSERIIHLIDQGILSIDAYFKPQKAISILKVREIEHGIFSFLLPHASCSLLSDNGCILSDESRPFGALELIPSLEQYPYCTNFLLMEEFDAIWEKQNVQDIMNKVIAYYSNGQTIESLVYNHLEAFEHDLLTGKCHYVPFDKYCIFQFGKTFGYQFDERIDSLLF